MVAANVEQWLLVFLYQGLIFSVAVITANLKKTGRLERAEIEAM